MQTVQQMITGSLRERSCSGGQETFLDKCRKFHAFYNVYMSRFNMQNPYLRTLDPASSPIVSRENRPLIQLGSNNYLGLSNHPEIKNAVKQAIDFYGTGSCSSRPLAGTTRLHIQLEEELAKFKESESALLFSTGYMTMMGTIYALAGEQDIILSDQLNHASIIDGIRLSKAQLKVYKHNDMRDLEENLASCDPKANKLIITDGVFSMMGDIAHLPQIKELAEHYGALTMVDDAHGTGVLGENGRGILEHFGMEGTIDLVCCTFSKTFGTVGGAVAAKKEIIDFLRFNSRPYIFTASLPPSVAMTVLASLDVIQKSPDLLTKLRKNTAFLKENLMRSKFRLYPTETPIIPLLIGDDKKTLSMALELEKEGVFVNPIIPPGVSVESSLIRLSVMATLTEEEMEFAVEKIKLVGRRVGIIS